MEVLAVALLRGRPCHASAFFQLRVQCDAQPEAEGLS